MPSFLCYLAAVGIVVGGIAVTLLLAIALVKLAAWWETTSASALVGDILGWVVPWAIGAMILVLLGIGVHQVAVALCR